MQIGELSKVVKLSIDTIRFYEKRGLLDGSHFIRQANGYRDYSDAAVQRLRLVRQAQGAGFTLTEIGEFVAAWENETIDKETKIKFLMLKMVEIRSRICDLQDVLAYLEQKLRQTTP